MYSPDHLGNIIVITSLEYLIDAPIIKYFPALKLTNTQSNNLIILSNIFKRTRQTSAVNIAVLPSIQNAIMIESPLSVKISSMIMIGQANLLSLLIAIIMSIAFTVMCFCRKLNNEKK